MPKKMQLFKEEEVAAFKIAVVTVRSLRYADNLRTVYHGSY